MRYILKADEMKACDQNTISRIGIPSMVLMERAALAVFEEILNRKPTPGKVLVVAGAGNNGGDGLAAGRLLAQKGARVFFYMAGSMEKMTDETKKQAEILKNLGVSIQSKLEDAEYDIVVDALFGIGLSREVEGSFGEVIRKINLYRQQGAFVCSVDIPSGICTDTGKILGCAVRADLTVTFAFAKRGHLLYPGKEYTGELEVKDIGITEKSFYGKCPSAFCYGREETAGLLPERRPDGNKGTFGKVVLIAGSRDMSGACILCGRATLRMGAGMVKIISPACNREIIQQALPEAMLYTYEREPAEEQVQEALAWADAAVAGPGMGQSANACRLMEYLLEDRRLPIVVDADGLNLLASSMELRELAEKRTEGKLIFTPHPGELMRLLNADKNQYASERESLIFTLARRYRCIVAAKDAVTMAVEEGKEIYINTSGNNGMASAGSGDVLAGMIGGLIAQGMQGFEAACLGIYLHGLAGDRAAVRKGQYGMMASDIIKALPGVMDHAF